MESVPDGLNRDGYASSTSLLSNPPGRRWSIGKRFLSVVLVISRSSARFVALGLPEHGRSLTSPDAA